VYTMAVCCLYLNVRYLISKIPQGLTRINRSRGSRSVGFILHASGVYWLDLKRNRIDHCLLLIGHHAINNKGFCDCRKTGGKTKGWADGENSEAQP
jgi:hypothetical protein